MQKPRYLSWIVEDEGITLNKKTPLNCYKLNYQLNEDVLDDWALHIRRHYESDDDILSDTSLNNMSVEEYLHEYIIPQKEDVLGSTARSSDITEILIADLLEFVFNYSVPRCKQRNRSGKCNSEHGTDVIAYRFSRKDKVPSVKDELIAAEVKAELTSKNYNVISKAVNDSHKDDFRLARTIDYYRKKLIMIGNLSASEEVARFLIKPENEYKTIFVAAGISSVENVERNIEIDVQGDKLIINSNQKVFYIHGKDLMTLTHQIYERCIR